IARSQAGDAHSIFMLALPVCGLVVSCDIEVFGSVDVHPHRTGVFPQPPSSNPGFGTTFPCPDAAGTTTKATVTAAASINNLYDAGRCRRPHHTPVFISSSSLRGLGRGGTCPMPATCGTLTAPG